MKEELATSSRTLALSLDVWPSENQIAIIGIISHWITPTLNRGINFSDSPGSIDRILERI